MIKLRRILAFLLGREVFKVSIGKRIWMPSSSTFNRKKTRAVPRGAKISGYALLLGPRRMFGSIIGAIFGLILVGPGFSFPSILLSIQAILAVFFLWGSASVTNMIYDLEIDKISEPDRPLPSGIVSKREAYIYAAILYGGVLTLLIALNNLYVWILSTVYVASSLIYSAPQIRGRDTVLKNFLVGVAGWVPLLIPVYLFQAADLNMLYLSISFYLGALFGSLGRDFKDYEAEAALSLKTVPVVLGLERAAQISFFGIIVFYLILVSGYYLVAPDLTLTLILLGVMALHVLIAYRFIMNRDDPGERKRFGQLFIMLPVTAILILITKVWQISWISPFFRVDLSH